MNHAERVVASLLFFGGSLICLGFCVALLYEGMAVLTGRWATISEITHAVVTEHTTMADVYIFLAGGLIFGLLVHFTGWRA